jgi:hypothetical protein
MLDMGLATIKPSVPCFAAAKAEPTKTLRAEENSTMFKSRK